MNKMSSSENVDSPVRNDKHPAVESRAGIDDLAFVQLAIKTEMKINIKDVNKGRLSPDDKGASDAKPVGFEIDE